MNYKLIYENLVERGQLRTSIVGYKERHHIIPRCMGGSDDTSNLVELTPEEHFLAHQLLVKIYPTSINLWRAALLMASGNPATNKGRNNNKLYGWLKRKSFDIYSGVEHQCKLCGSKFLAYSSSNRVYCSRACRAKLGQLRPVQVGKEMHKCIICETTFETYKCLKRKFCSTDCKSKSQENKVTLCCKICNNDFQVLCSRSKKRQYCSPECARKRYFY
jgi:hypothetical protein